MMVQACNSSTWEAEAGESAVEWRLGNLASSRPAWATNWDPLSKQEEVIQHLPSTSVPQKKKKKKSCDQIAKHKRKL
jgi:hypothetical protein